jgi:hypothetical protein
MAIRYLWTDGLRGYLSRVFHERSWLAIEKIPGDERLWRSVYRPEQVKPDGTLKPSFFKNKNGTSCDLARFSTMEKSRRGYGVPPQWPEEAGLVEFTVSMVRNVDADVLHAPTKVPFVNYSHADAQIYTTGQAKRLVEQSPRVLVASRIKPKS